MNSPTLISLRPWTLEDVDFSLTVRNHPLLIKWFRQDEPLSREAQLEFIKQDIGPYGGYNGQVIEADGERVGLCGVKTGTFETLGEFTIAILPEHQGRGIAKWAMAQLVRMEVGVWSEVFVGNPALEFFISKCGFKVTGCKERAYYKKGIGLVDTITLRHE